MSKRVKDSMGLIHCPSCDGVDISAGRQTDWLKDSFTPMHCNSCGDNWSILHEEFRTGFYREDSAIYQESHRALKPTEIRCASCGEIFDIHDEEKSNWYEDQRDEVLDDGTYVVVGKIQHSVDECGEVNLVTFHGKMVKVEKRR